MAHGHAEHSLPTMKPFLYAALAAYVVAAIHSILALLNKRRAVERVSFFALLAVFLFLAASPRIARNQAPPPIEIAPIEIAPGSTSK